MDVLRLHRGAGIATLTLARPEARNALNLELCHALTEAFVALDLDPEIRVVMLCAEGGVFCAGADMKERKGRDDAWVMRRRRASFRAYETIETCRKPVVAVAQGPVVGAGGEIVMSCDFALASTAASFRFPEPRWGTVGATQRLHRVIGKARAKELLFTGREMPAEEAHALGLTARLVAPEALDAAAAEIAAAIAKAPPLAMRLTKHCVDQGATTDLRSGIGIELAAIERNLAESDWQAGLDAFGKSRRPD